MSSNEESLDSYQQQIEDGVDEALELAQDARKVGGDPSDHVEIDFADDLAERTEKLLGIDGIQDRIRELEEDHDREELVLELAKEFAAGNIGTSETKEGKLDDAIRTAVAVLTEAIVAAPIEGIDEVVIEQNDDGTEYIRIRYAGPIRSAGGTAQALSVLVADYLRQEFDLAPFKPRDDEVERYIEEIRIYESEKSLQYSPSDEEIRTIVRNLSIFIDAEQVTDREVGGYRDLERIDGNRARGGMCLVIAEGTGLKAAKLQKYTRALDLDGWDWLSELPNSADESDEEEESEEDDGEQEPQGQTEFKPKDKFIKDLTGGRPVFSYPQAKGGFRLRYGKARNSGLAASGVNPATMHILDDFIATGTQLKTERPGKAQGMVPVSGCEGPTVKLYNGTVTRIDTLERAKELREQVDEIIDIGEMAVPYGEFLENNHHLPPSPYVHDWWLQDAEENGLDLETLPPEKINSPQAFAFGQKHDIPLHPKYTYLWNDITPEEYKELSQHVHKDENQTEEDTLNLPTEIKPILEKLLLHHTQPEDDTLEVERDHAITLKKVTDPDITLPDDDETETLELVNKASPITVRDRAALRIGARMARPEKAKQREQQPAINGLVPVGYEGGNQRDILTSAKSATSNYDVETGEQDKTALPKGTIHADLSQRKCPICEQTTWQNKCPSCDERTEPYAICNKCGTESNIDGTGECPECEHEIKSWGESRFPIGEALQEALDNTDARHDQFKTIKGVRGLFSNTKVVEPLEKAILRAKHDLSIYDDGTIRYDMSDIPLTAFKPKETHATIEQLKELGYNEDIHGEPLEEDDQLLELKPQDIIINDDAGETLLDIANFIDDLLEAHYDMEPYYNAETKEDIIGELVIGLAPHTSGGVVGRLIGYTKASIGFAHPFFHAAKRRNCFHPDTELTYKHNGEWKNNTIQHLVETHLTENADDSYDDGSIVQSIKDHPDIEELKVPSLTEEGERTLENVTHLSKHQPQEILKITLENGTETKVTPDHEIPVRVSDSETVFKKKKAKNISTDDELIEYEEDAYKEEDSKELNTLSVTKVEKTDEYTEVYDITVENTHILEINGHMCSQCDGDEDSVMLLMDGLLNYSEKYLNHDRRGWSMDRPLVLTRHLDPEEIDDEAHNVEMVERFSKEFYEDTQKGLHPKDVDVLVAEDVLDELGGDVKEDFRFHSSLEVGVYDEGPDNSAYKTLGSMDEKVEGQLELARKVRAVDEDNVAQKVIEDHFIPDLMGNLRSFSQQKVYCNNQSCGEKYRRPPLQGVCRECGMDSVKLSMYEGMVSKYIDAMLEMAEKYELEPYVEQRVREADKKLDSLFEDDTEKQTGLGDFV